MGSFIDRNRPSLSAQGLRFGIVAARFNREITRRLLEGALKVLRQKRAKRVDSFWVPGSFEIPLTLAKLIRSRRYDALIALGAVIRGETPHFDFVAQEASRGVMEVMLKEGIPIAFGILTTDNEKQARERAGGRRGNKGQEAAWVAIEMARKVKDGLKA